jgi:cupin fold WbuC family metalloprotein
VIRLIDNALLDEVSREAVASPRGRRNRNFHIDDGQPAHRLLNAIEPGSYVRPHRHLEVNKDETMVVLRGELGLVTFDDSGKPTRVLVLGAGCDALGVDLAHGTWHMVFALVPGTIFLEAKAGPYLPLTPAEQASWAPAEGAAEAAAYLAGLVMRTRAGR